jgi:hypothetical protein
MNRSKSVVLGMVAVSAVALLAEAPAVNIDQQRHGNLWAAQKDILAAYEKVGEAQAANHGKLGGHAEKARELLTQASRELKLAAEAANRR